MTEKRSCQTHRCTLNIGGLISKCLFLPVDIREIEDKVSIDINDLKMKDLCIFQDGHPKEIFFGLDQELERDISTIRKMSEISIFRSCWNSTLFYIESGKDIFLLNDVIDSIWKPVHEDLACLLEHLFSEEISLDRVDKIFKDYRDSTKGLHYELCQLDYLINGAEENNAWIDRVVRRIHYFFDLQKCQINAECVLEIKAMLQLQGDFSAFEDIIRQVNKF